VAVHHVGGHVTGIDVLEGGRRRRVDVEAR
jgi:hypothetical protein